jgi:hypothetical protein
MLCYHDTSDSPPVVSEPPQQRGQGGARTEGIYILQIIIRSFQKSKYIPPLYFKKMTAALLIYSASAMRRVLYKRDPPSVSW